MRARPLMRARCIVALVCAAGSPAALRAHHSTAEYDSANVVEAQGEITKVLWQNPHVRIEISTQRFDGVAEPWLLEGQNPTDLDRARRTARHRQSRRHRQVRRQRVDAARAPHVRHERLARRRNGARAARERSAALVAGPLPEPSPSDRSTRRASPLTAPRASSAFGCRRRRQDAGMGDQSAADGRRACRLAGATTPSVTIPSSTAGRPACRRSSRAAAAMRFGSCGRVTTSS